MLPVKLRAAAFLVAFSTPGLAGEAGGCVSDWSVAAPIVRQEKLMTVEQLAKLVRSRLASDIVTASLCTSGGGRSYRLVVRNAAGQLKTVTLDARTPFARASTTD